MEVSANTPGGKDEQARHTREDDGTGKDADWPEWPDLQSITNFVAKAADTH